MSASDDMASVEELRAGESRGFDQMMRRHGLLGLGPEAVLYGVLDEIVDGYAPVIAGLENDIDEIEDELFRGDESVSRRIYELLTVPVLQLFVGAVLLCSAQEGLEDAAQRRGRSLESDDLADVLDHVLRIAERADSFRVLLENALTVHSTLVTQQQNAAMRELSEAALAQSVETKRLSEQSIAQNDEIKKITGWAAILFAPTLVGTVYGMNFENMPELGWEWGYPLSILTMVGLGAGLWFVFKSKRRL